MFSYAPVVTRPPVTSYIYLGTVSRHLESNQLTTLPNGLFSDLGSLEEL